MFSYFDITIQRPDYSFSCRDISLTFIRYSNAKIKLKFYEYIILLYILSLRIHRNLLFANRYPFYKINNLSHLLVKFKYF